MDCKYRKKEEVDKIMKMKQTFALLCAGAMVITGSAFPVNVQASADWVWNEEESALYRADDNSGYGGG